MADIELVIKIDKENYEYIKKYTNDEILPVGWHEIINGTPLPKIDRPIIHGGLTAASKNKRRNNAIISINKVFGYHDTDAISIIEADKRENEEV